MNPLRFLAATSLLFATACSTTQGTSYSQARRAEQAVHGRVTGIVGIAELTALDLEVDPSVGTASGDGDLSVPLIAAQFQVPLRQQRLEWGYEGGFSLGWESDRDAVVIDTGTVLVRADNDLRVFDLSGGLYVSRALGERLRVYGGAGPLFQFGSIDLELDQDIGGEDSIDEDGFGMGYYTRVGLDLAVSPRTTFGFVVRWVDSNIDLGPTLRDIDFQALQVGLAVTTVY
jgi:opacity protein-like surface antigen